MAFEKWYNKRYKKLLFIPGFVLALAVLYLIIFYVQTGDIINKDVSLTGGTTVAIFTDASASELESFLSASLSDFRVRAISDGRGNQVELAVIVSEDDSSLLKSLLEEFLGEELNSSNSSIETTSASLSEEFYRQLLTAILLAFFWMSAVVYVIFSKDGNSKAKVIMVNILLGFFLGNFFFRWNMFISGALLLAFTGYLFNIYIRSSIPAFAVILSAFADIVMTLAVVNFVGMELSTAGIVAFLMLIGYSVDTDILLTTRLLNRKGRSVNDSLRDALVTGATLTVTSLIAVGAALIAVYSFGSVLNQIFTILLIGLGFDLFNTWITNASMIKWYVEELK